MSKEIYSTLLKEGEVKFKTDDGEFKLKHIPSYSAQSPTDLINEFDSLFMDIDGANLTLNDFFETYLSVDEYEEILETSETLYRLVTRLMEALEERNNSVTFLPIFESSIDEDYYFLGNMLNITNIEESVLVGFFVVSGKNEDIVKELSRDLESLFIYIAYYYQNALYSLYSNFDGEENLEFFDAFNSVIVPIIDESWILKILQFNYDYDDSTELVLID